MPQRAQWYPIGATEGEPVDLQHIKEFICLAQHGSFRAAARVLFVSQPTLSKHISILEGELGCALVERGAETHLTPAGRYFLKEVTGLVDRVDTALDTIAAGTRAASNNLVELSIPDFSRSILGYAETILRARTLFESSYAPLRLELNSVLPFSSQDVDRSLTLEEVIDGGAVNWMIHIASPCQAPEQVKSRFEPQGLSCFKLASSPCRLIVETSHPLAGKQVVTREDLAAYPFLCNRYPVCYQESYRQAIVDELRAHGIAAPVEQVYQNDGPLNSWGGSCRLENRIAPAPELTFSFMGFSDQDHHTVLPVQDFEMRFDFYVVYRERPDDEAFTAFMRILREVAR